MSLVTLATFITFRMAGFPDLSVDGVFALGAVVFVKCVSLNVNYYIAIIIVVLCGGLIGATTSLISQRLTIHPLLASVLILIMLSTINLRILGKPNIPLIEQQGAIINNYFLFPIIALTSFSIIIISYFILKTEIGCALRITGSCPSFLLHTGKNPKIYRIILVSISGILVSISGCLLALKYHYADVYFGNGIIIVGITSLIAGEKLCGKNILAKQILSIPCGAFVYQFVTGVVLYLGVSSMDVKMATAILTIILLAFGTGKEDDLFANIR